MSADQRKAVLAQTIGRWVAAGSRVESQSEFQAVMVSGKQTNHILHLLLSLFTCGLWVIVWVILAVMNTEKRAVLSVDEYGQILRH